MTTQLVRHGVDVTEVGVVEGHASKHFPFNHLRPGFNVVAICHCFRQVLLNQLDGLFTLAVGNVVVVNGNVWFNGLNVGIQTSSRSRCLRDPQHQHWVVEGNQRNVPPGNDNKLQVRFFVRDYGVAGQF